MKYLLALLLAGCSTWQPQDVRSVLIDWKTPCQEGPPIVQQVRIIDTQFPLLDCIRYANPRLKTEMIMLTVAGFPPMACALQIGKNPQTGMEETEIFTSLAYFGDKLTNDILVHELRHAFGDTHGGTWMPFVHQCREGKHD